MSTLVSSLTIDEFKDLIDDSIHRKLSEIFNDEDFGLELKDSVIKRLKEQRESVQKGNFGKDMNEVLKELGIY